MIASDGSYGMKEIKPIGKGSVPLNLRGSFTSVSLAQKAVDQYIQSKPAKVE
ncbi:hypothetical protein D3C85_1836310 [compost metagenome]